MLIRSSPQNGYSTSCNNRHFQYKKKIFKYRWTGEKNVKTGQRNLSGSDRGYIRELPLACLSIKKDKKNKQIYFMKDAFCFILRDKMIKPSKCKQRKYRYINYKKKNMLYNLQIVPPIIPPTEKNIPPVQQDFPQPSINHGSEELEDDDLGIMFFICIFMYLLICCCITVFILIIPISFYKIFILLLWYGSVCLLFLLLETCY